MLLSCHQNRRQYHNIRVANVEFQKLEEFKYLELPENIHDEISDVSPVLN
jgi:hypothetical protein